MQVVLLSANRLKSRALLQKVQHKETMELGAKKLELKTMEFMC